MTVDVVTVPDFSTPAVSGVFEARTLLFLAAWMENAGEARSFPLHLACIGQPPPSVQWLAARCGAEVTTHTPTQAEPVGYSNKLRGLEVHRRAEQVLLLDTDVVTLADPSPISQMGVCLSALPSIWPRVPEDYWYRLYAALDLEPPAERIRSLIGELGRAPMRQPLYPAQNAETQSMIPYFNSGVVYAPWAVDLRGFWEKGIRHVVDQIERRDKLGKGMVGSDQVGLALAIELLKRQGIPFQRMPNCYHTVWLHIFRRALPLSQARLYHAMHLFSHATQPGNYERALLNFRMRLLQRIIIEWSRELALNYPAKISIRAGWQALHENYQLGLRLHKLYHKHVIPALHQTPVRVQM